MRVGETNPPPPTIVLDDRFLIVEFSEPHLCLSWAVIGGGTIVARRVIWHQVYDRELSLETDPVALFEDRLGAHGLTNSGVIGLMTSADLSDYVESSAEADGLEVRSIATVGLGNLLRAGDPPGPPTGVGTINLVVWTSAALSPLGRLEALSIAAEARTLAVREADLVSTYSSEPASGTGTDCIVIAAPIADAGLVYAGKHTTVGHLIGRTVEEAVRVGIQRNLRVRAAT